MEPPEFDYSKAPEPKDDPSWGRPRYAWAILFTFSLTVAYIIVYPRLPYDVWMAIADTYPFFWIPFLGSLILQSSVRGVERKFATTLIGWVGFIALYWCIGMMSMLGGD